MASDRRLELLDLLAQGPRHVDALADETDMSSANVSQHLQVLRAAHLVETDKDGTRVLYRLGGDDVLQLWLALRTVAEHRLPEIGLIRSSFAIDGAEDSPLTLDEVLARQEQGKLTLIDVRPPLEYENGHLPGAISLPPDELPARASELPHDVPVIAYCRGTYCQFADEAVVYLNAHGWTAYRLDGGWLEWKAAESSPANEVDRDRSSGRVERRT